MRFKLSLLFLALATFAFAAPDRSEYAAGFDDETLGKIKDVPITGEAQFPTPVIFSLLGMEDLRTAKHARFFRNRSQWRLAGTGGSGSKEELVAFLTDPVNEAFLKKGPLLSLGEGISGYVPHLRKLGIEATGLDLAYDSDAKAKAHFEKYKDFLVKGDATDLSRWKDEQFHFISSHRLFSYLKAEQKIASLQESFRVLKTGGRMHHEVVLSTEPRSTTWGLLAEDEPRKDVVKIATALLEKALAGKRYNYALEFRTSEWDFFYFGDDADLKAEWKDREEANLREVLDTLDAKEPVKNVVDAIRRSDKFHRERKFVSLLIRIEKLAGKK